MRRHPNSVQTRKKNYLKFNMREKISYRISNKFMFFMCVPENLETIIKFNIFPGLTDCSYFLTKQIACHEIVLELTNIESHQVCWKHFERHFSRNAACTPVSISTFAMVGNINLWHVILDAVRSVYAYTHTIAEDRKAEIVLACRYVTWTTVCMFICETKLSIPASGAHRGW